MPGTVPAATGVAVVVPAFNEEETIAEVVADFLGREDVDRVIVVDNASGDATAERAGTAGAEVVREEAPGYGRAIRTGLDHAFASGAELCAVTEADGSFQADDLSRLLAALGTAELVLGTRTQRALVAEGANMRPLLRWGNRAVALLVRLFWSRTPALTDVGCSYRVLSAGAWERVRAGLNEPGAAFAAEMICEARMQGLRWVEVPVRYGPRLGGRSKHSASFFGIARTALAMLRTICRKRLGLASRSGG